MEKHFTVAAIPDLANKLTPSQKQVFNAAWSCFISSNKPFPTRSIQPIIGKQPIQEVFKDVSGSLIQEQSEPDGRCFKLTSYGAFLSADGSLLANLLTRLLELIKTLYEEDAFIKTIDNNQIKKQLEISDLETELLFKLLKLQMPPDMPFHLSSSSGDGSSWTLSITDNVIELYRSENSAKYLDERLSAGFKPDEPCLYDDRQRPILKNTSSPYLPPDMFSGTIFQHPQQSASSYVSLSRIDELKKIKSARFDCTRLICMCEELNECAFRSNAHAVIMLTRAIIDHVPPAFGFGSFKEVASNYGEGGSSFKKSAERLENHSKKIADRLLHMPIRDKEIAPNMHEVSFTSELEALLAEFCRLLKNDSA